MQNPFTCSCENGGYARSIIDNSVVMCDEITDAAYSVSNIICSVPINVANTISINIDDKKVG